MSAYGDFWRGLLSDPRGVSAPTPSSPALAAAIAAEVDMGRPGLVVELGPGTGVVTAALLDRGIAPERIVAIEQGRYFADLLERNFPALTIICGDAFQFETYLPEGARIAAIVSGVPLLNFPLEARRSLIARALLAQGRGGRFVQLSYGWRPPVAPRRAVHLGKKTVWRNFPPAHVFTYRAAAAGAGLSLTPALA